MARKRVVSRTIKGLQVTTMTLNIVTAEPGNATYTIGNSFKDDEKLLSYIKKVYDSDETKNVAIVDKTVTCVKYEMNEDDYIKAARVVEHVEAE